MARMNLKEQKRALRREMRALRAALPADYVTSAGRRMQDRVLSLPMHPYLTEEEIEEVKAKKEEAALKASGLYHGEHARPHARGRNYDPNRFKTQINPEPQSEVTEENEAEANNE